MQRRDRALSLLERLRLAKSRARRRGCESSCDATLHQRCTCDDVPGSESRRFVAINNTTSGVTDPVSLSALPSSSSSHSIFNARTKAPAALCPDALRSPDVMEALAAFLHRRQCRFERLLFPVPRGPSPRNEGRVWAGRKPRGRKLLLRLRRDAARSALVVTPPSLPPSRPACDAYALHPKERIIPLYGPPRHFRRAVFCARLPLIKAPRWGRGNSTGRGGNMSRVRAKIFRAETALRYCDLSVAAARECLILLNQYNLFPAKLAILFYVPRCVCLP